MESAQTRAEGKRLIEQFEKTKKHTTFLRNRKKYGRFQTLCGWALALGEALDLNVEISTENPYAATIQFMAGCCYIIKEVPEEIHRKMGMFFLLSDEAWIDCADGIIRLLFLIRVNDVLVD